MKDYFLSPNGNERTTEVKSKQTIFYSEPKLDLSLLKKKSSAKTSSGIVLGYLKKLKNIPLDYKIMLQEMYKEIKNLEVSEKIRIDSWKGKDKIKIWIKPNSVIIERHQRKEPGEKPKEVKSEVTKEEINLVINSLNKLKERFNNKIPTRDIAEYIYNKKWDNVFSDRPEHIKLVDILNVLDYYKIIHYYRSGSSSILNNCLDIQEVLTSK